MAKKIGQVSKTAKWVRVRPTNIQMPPWALVLHEISNNVVFARSKASGQPAHTRISRICDN